MKKNYLLLILLFVFYSVNAQDNNSQNEGKNELKLKKSMVDNLEGFPESIHFLTKQKEWNNKIPLLTDIIYVDEKYRVAIENFLEPLLNYFVVADYPTALQAVDTLIILPA